MRIGQKRIIFLAGIVALAVSFIAAPIYTKSADSDAVRCDACHVIEADEFSRSEIHKMLNCAHCHNISEFGPDLYTHNSTTEQCTSCHSSEGIRLGEDAHSNLQNASNASSALKGSNEACVICHTGVEVEIEWHSYESLVTNATKINGTWIVNYSLRNETFWNTTKNETSMKS